MLEPDHDPAGRGRDKHFLAVCPCVDVDDAERQESGIDVEQGVCAPASLAAVPEVHEGVEGRVTAVVRIGGRSDSPAGSASSCARTLQVRLG